jgi:hypothetical protein
LVRRRKRDVYGNWVWEDDDEIRTPSQGEGSNDQPDGKINRATRADSSDRDMEGEEMSLDWRDFVALSIASLETFLLPIVVFILILLAIVLGLTFFH